MISSSVNKQDASIATPQLFVWTVVHLYVYYLFVSTNPSLFALCVTRGCSFLWKRFSFCFADIHDSVLSLNKDKYLYFCSHELDVSYVKN